MELKNSLLIFFRNLGEDANKKEFEKQSFFEEI